MSGLYDELLEKDTYGTYIEANSFNICSKVTLQIKISFIISSRLGVDVVAP